MAVLTWCPLTYSPLTQEGRPQQPPVRAKIVWCHRIFAHVGKGQQNLITAE